MTEINRQPSGLSDLLLVRAGGRNPDNLSETVRPTLDIEPYYWPDRMRGATQAFSLGSDNVSGISVPDNEVWRVLAVGHTLTANRAAGAVYGVTYGIERLPGQGLNGIEFGAFNSVENTVNREFSNYVQLAFPLFATGGQVLTITCHHRSGADIAGTFEILYVLIQD